MKRIAVVTTIYRYLSHAQHIGDRFLVGYPRDGAWHKPDMKVVSLYVDQKPEGDQSAARAKEFGFPVYPTIAEALRCGGSKLAVDAVLVIGEHGEYPRNEKGQKLYPRYEFFKQCVEVFEKDGVAVPVYNDKHLSYSFEKAKWMVDASRRLKFPMLAGSSLPVTWRLPDIELPLNCRDRERAHGRVRRRRRHGLPRARSDAVHGRAAEGRRDRREGRADDRRRRGVEGGRGGAVLQGAARVGALAERHAAGPDASSTAARRTSSAKGELPKLVKNPAAYFIEYRDGLKATLLMLNGAVKDFTFAARVKGSGVQSTQFFLSPEPNVTYSACLVGKIEELFETGKAPYPVERTLLVSGVLESCLTSRLEGQKRLETPHLDVRYRAPRQSQHTRT